VSAVGVSATNLIGNELTNTTSNSVILNTQQEFWGS